MATTLPAALSDSERGRWCGGRTRATGLLTSTSCTLMQLAPRNIPQDSGLLTLAAKDLKDAKNPTGFCRRPRVFLPGERYLRTARGCASRRWKTSRRWRAGLYSEALAIQPVHSLFGRPRRRKISGETWAPTSNIERGRGVKSYNNLQRAAIWFYNASRHRNTSGNQSTATNINQINASKSLGSPGPHKCFLQLSSVERVY